MHIKIDSVGINTYVAILHIQWFICHMFSNLSYTYKHVYLWYAQIATLISKHVQYETTNT